MNFNTYRTMAGHKNSKYYDYFLKYNVYLSYKNDEYIIDNNLFKLLSIIREKKSISEAAKAMNLSYRKAWGDIKKAEEKLGFSFVKRNRGGTNGGQSLLTNEGEQIVNSYEKLIKEFNIISKNIIKDFFNNINS